MLWLEYCKLGLVFFVESKKIEKFGSTTTTAKKTENANLTDDDQIKLQWKRLIQSFDQCYQQLIVITLV